jgi:hypothetical protein
VKTPSGFAGERPAPAQHESILRRGFRRLRPLYAPDTVRELNWQESVVTATAWVVMLGVVVALIYVVFTVNRFAQAL